MPGAGHPVAISRVGPWSGMLSHPPPLRSAIVTHTRTPYRSRQMCFCPDLIPDIRRCTKEHYTPTVPLLDAPSSHVSSRGVAWHHLQACISPRLPTAGPFPYWSGLAFSISPHPRQLLLCMLPLTASARGAIMHNSSPDTTRMPLLPHSLFPSTSKASSRSR